MSDSPQEDQQAKRTRVVEEEETEKKEVPSWLSAPTSAPAWASTASASAAPSWLLPATSSFGGASTAAAAPSWLTSSSASSAFGAESGNAFGALSTAASVFGAKKPDEGGEEEDNGEDDKSSTGGGGEEDEEAATFGHGAEEDQAPLASAVETGEEHEVVLCQHRVKLYQLSKGDDEAGVSPAWVELGFGPLRLNAPINTQDDSLLSRLVMRRQGVWTLLLNSPVNLAFAHQVVGDKMLRVACEHFNGKESAPHTYLVKFARQDDRDEFAAKLRDVTGGGGGAKKTGLVEATATTDK